MKEYSIAIGLSIVLCLIAFFIRDRFLVFFTTEIIGESPLLNNSWRLPGQVLPESALFDTMHQ